MRLSAGVQVEAVVRLMIGTRARRTVRLSEAGKCDGPQLQVNFVPSYGKIVCSVTSELLVVGEQG